MIAIKGSYKQVSTHTYTSAREDEDALAPAQQCNDLIECRDGRAGPRCSCSGMTKKRSRGERNTRTEAHLQ